ncbi:MAG: hypothetical protein WAL59_08110 [Roseiarcus sp.]
MTTRLAPWARRLKAPTACDLFFKGQPQLLYDHLTGPLAFARTYDGSTKP